MRQPLGSHEAVRERAAAIARERGCNEAACLLEQGHRFPRLSSALKPTEQRALAALRAARLEV